MATSTPKMDGPTAARVLSEYAEWDFDGGEDPVEPALDAAPAAAPPAAPTTAPAAASSPPAGAHAAGGAGPKDWAEWVARKLEEHLQAVSEDPTASARRRAAARRAVERVKGWK